jgi:hypothetical protein
MSSRACMAVLLTLALPLSACGGDGDSGAPDRNPGSAVVGTEEGQQGPYVAKPYRPDPAEGFANGKRLAARIAQRALTYELGTSAVELASSLPRGGMSKGELARILAPAVDAEMRSVGEVVYPQLSGLTPDTLGAMVLTRQVLQDAEGERQSVVRVLDVRLRLAGDSWAFEELGSVGGSPVPRPSSLPAAAERVLESPSISLSDSARWDIYRGTIDPSLLHALAAAASKHELSVGILRSGHPANVWATARPSAHSQGFAADIYAVDGELVVRQRETGSAAYAVARGLVLGGAYQLGSPWVFGESGVSSFTDDVHADHLHVQQSPAL